MHGVEQRAALGTGGRLRPEPRAANKRHAARISSHLLEALDCRLWMHITLGMQQAVGHRTRMAYTGRQVLSMLALRLDWQASASPRCRPGRAGGQAGSRRHARVAQAAAELTAAAAGAQDAACRQA